MSMDIKDVAIKTEEIQLDQFLKWAGVLASGGELKELLAEGRVYRNGERESARRRKLHPGDVVKVEGLGAWQVVQDAG